VGEQMLPYEAAHEVSKLAVAIANGIQRHVIIAPNTTMNQKRVLIRLLSVIRHKTLEKAATD
jgi:hypothetical protein